MTKPPRLSIGAASPLSGLIVDGALEIARSGDPTVGWGERDILVVERDERVELPASLRVAAANWQRTHADEWSGVKVSLQSFDLSTGRPALTLVLARTEWADVQVLHQRLLWDLETGLRMNALSVFVRERRTELPNILTIHGLLETTDGYLVLGKRSPHARYHPAHWSASFEEGLELSDITGERGAAHRAALRGVREEFTGSDDSRGSRCTILAFSLEIGILNPALIALVQVPQTREELTERAQHSSLDDEFNGVLDFVPYELGVLGPLVSKDHFVARSLPAVGGPWHPTSRYRLLMAMVHRFGLDATERAIISEGRD